MPKNLKEPYVYALGINHQSSLKRNQKLFDDKEEEAILSMSKDARIYEKVTNSIAPAIFGNEDIKKAIACLLFGGTRKTLPDKMRLRGDINILLIGDPSTGKSQFLKFVERTAPISVYTSGKGSSAAGLTASITRDKQTGEFTIEVGAMVLGDGGVVCIDEFDKMKPQDRVAIHEAMEQQTISIAKADITTKLNSRTSVLAAANPIFGSYNDLKQIEEQIELQTTILSRFDCIFIVRDTKSEAHDKRMAEHILNLHIQGGNMQVEQEQLQQGDFTIEQLKKYVAYAKAKIHPTLTEHSAEKIKSLYVEDRQKSMQKGATQKKQHIPVTVRQLEAIIRLSEAVAKIHLSQEVKEEHIEEAHRIFQNSTLNAISSGKEIGIELPQQMEKFILKMEESIKKRVSINQKVDFAKLKEEMDARFHNETCFDYAITNLIKNKVFQHIEGKRVIQRIR